MSAIDNFLQFIYDGNWLGLIQAIYVSAFQYADLFYGLLSGLFFVGFYIRTHSLAFISLIWILLGSFFLVAMPMVSGLAIFFMIFGFAGVLFKLYALAQRG